MEKYYNKLNKKLDNLQAANHKHHKSENCNPQRTFHSHTINLTNISFTTEELELLNQGMQYSIQQPNRTQWTTLILEMEQAIRLLEPKIQDTYHFMTAKKTLTNTQYPTQHQQEAQMTATHPEKHTQQTRQEQSNNHTDR